MKLMLPMFGNIVSGKSHKSQALYKCCDLFHLPHSINFYGVPKSEAELGALFFRSLDFLEHPIISGVLFIRKRKKKEKLKNIQ